MKLPNLSCQLQYSDILIIAYGILNISSPLILASHTTEKFLEDITAFEAFFKYFGDQSYFLYYYEILCN